MSKKLRIQAFVTEDTKKAILKKAKDASCSESYVAGRILEEAMKPTPELINLGKFPPELLERLKKNYL